MSSIAILLVLYNDSHHIPALTNSLNQQIYQGFDVFAVETSIGGKSIRLLKKLYPRAKCFEYMGNLGYAKGNNYLLSKAKKQGYRYAVVVNSDIILARSCIVELKHILDNHKNIALAGPIVYKGTPEGKNEIQNYNLVANFKKGTTTYQNLHLPEHMLPEKNKTDLVSGCAFMCKISALSRENLFCEDNFMYGDELDLAYRLKRKGFIFMVTKQAKVWHNHDWSKENKSGTRMQYYYMPRNRFLFMRRYGMHRELYVNFLEELFLFPFKIRWAIKKQDMGLLKVYYHGIFNGFLGNNKLYKDI